MANPKAKAMKPDFVISIACTKSKISEDIIVRYTVVLDKMIATEETRYPVDQGEALTKEFLKGIQKLGELVDLEAKNNPLITNK